MTGLAKHLGITKVRIGQLCKEKRLRPDFKINGRNLWKPPTAESLKKAFQVPGAKGSPKEFYPQKERRKKNQFTVTQDQENFNVTETVPVNNSDKENLDTKKQKPLIQTNQQESQKEKEINMAENPKRNVETMQEIKVFEERKFRWQCPGCCHKNTPNVLETNGSIKKELQCWACNLIIKFDEETKAWYKDRYSEHQS